VISWIGGSTIKRRDRAQPVERLSILGKNVVRAFEANSFFSRLRGLHAFLPLGEDEALIIRPCNAVHTMTMRNKIDVVFVDHAGAVLRAVTVPPLRFKRCSSACAVVEMSEGMIEKMGIVDGDVLVRQHGAWV